MNYNFAPISYREAVQFLLPRHYSGRKPVIQYAFGAFIDERLIACCTYGVPASRPLCVGIMGKENFKKVIELNRLYVLENQDLILSQFLAWTLRQLSGPLCVVSYADTAMSHFGAIYQATNFLYTGKTKSRTDKFTDGNRHCRHYDKSAVEVKRKVRSSKHRYIYLVGNKTDAKKMVNDLNYPILPYPKGKSLKYQEGFVLEQEVYFVGNYDK